MVSVPGIFKDGKITLLQPIPNIKHARVIVTVLEDVFVSTEQKNSDIQTIEPENTHWLGCMSHTLVGELGDIVSPMEDTWSDWEVLRE